MTLPPIDFDGPWKSALETYLADFLAFFFPEAHAEIDWSRGYVFLDKELQQIAPESEAGRQLADKLVQVWRRDGTDAWVLVHIEVQSQEQREFARRMFTYHYRLFDRYQRQVVSLAVLGDERATWRPDSFGYALWGCELALRFPIAKLVDYRSEWASLEGNANPFATVVLAHLTAQETRQDAEGRAQAKVRLTRRLYSLGYSREQIVGLYRFLDWLLRLPAALDRQVWQTIRQYEEEQHMTYITTAERIGMEQGRREGLLEGIALGLRLKFGAAGQALMDEIGQIDDPALVQAIFDRIETATTIEEIRQVYEPASKS
jgi:hypothetical protein